jgi:hypothetical protein
MRILCILTWVFSYDFTIISNHVSRCHCCSCLYKSKQRSIKIFRTLSSVGDGLEVECWQSGQKFSYFEKSSFTGIGSIPVGIVRKNYKLINRKVFRYSSTCLLLDPPVITFIPEGKNLNSNLDWFPTWRTKFLFIYIKFFLKRCTGQSPAVSDDTRGWYI